MLLGILQCTGQNPRTKNYLAPNVDHAVVEKLCVSDFECKCVCVARGCI